MSVAPPPPDGIVFRGPASESDPIYGEKRDIPDKGYIQVKLTGDQSIYILYDVTNLSLGSTPDKVQFVTSTDWVDLDFKPPRSTKGHSKTGIILFSTYNFGGTSEAYIDNVSDLKDTFPQGLSGGVSTFVVINGNWELYTSPHFSENIVIDDQKIFTAGDRKSMPSAVNDQMRSLKRVQD